MPLVALIIFREVQTSEAWRRTNNLQRNRRKECYIENANSQVEFRRINQEFEPQQGIVLELVGLMQ
jgi:hypothetical protein